MAAKALPSIPDAMQAWHYSKFGGGADDLELSSVPVPVPKKGELLVKVHVAAVNPGDWKVQKGLLRPFLPSKLPAIPGLDIAGEVVKLGPTTEGYALGDQVFGMASVWTGGSLAQYALLPTVSTAKRPANVPAAQAACLGIAAITALCSLRDYGKLALGPFPQGSKTPPEYAAQKKPARVQNVLVAGASGGVGHYAVQLAKLAQQHVTATCGKRNLSMVRSLGADEVLDYATPEGEALASPSGRKYDVVVDCVGLKAHNVFAALAPTARWVQNAPDLAFFGRFLLSAVSPFPAKQKISSVFAAPKAADLEYLGSLASQGSIRARIEEEFPFREAQEAWRRSIAGHVSGKVVVRVSDEE